MSAFLENELEQVRSLIFKMADLVIEAIANSVESLKESDNEKARTVISSDAILDDLEILIDNECIKILVTQQPAATDLRLVLAMLKINTDLERMGDLAVNVARETIRLDGRSTIKPLIDVSKMANICIDMIKLTFNAISKKDSELARKIIGMDKDIDLLNVEIYKELFSFMEEYKQSIPECLGLIMVAKALERIGDHATNIAERTIYYVDGVDIRHGNE